ncbi:MAG: hypothetical protein RIR97_1686 [Pseudomonadota bacterium]
MRTTQPLTITLPHEMAQMVKSKVQSGEYASESEVIRDGLRTLAMRDAAIEKWMANDVIPTLDALEADASRAVPVQDAWRRIQAHMDMRSKKSAAE